MARFSKSQDGQLPPIYSRVYHVSLRAHLRHIEPAGDSLLQEAFQGLVHILYPGKPHYLRDSIHHSPPILENKHTADADYAAHGRLHRALLAPRVPSLLLQDQATARDQQNRRRNLPLLAKIHAAIHVPERVQRLWSGHGVHHPCHLLPPRRGPWREEEGRNRRTPHWHPVRVRFLGRFCRVNSERRRLHHAPRPEREVQVPVCGEPRLLASHPFHQRAGIHHSSHFFVPGPLLRL
mmetsp:Transcript_28968/g.54684  ORF Transcript_28968/g.54684 Transcript_28968/m.54684 type:complete len:236 (+) Transcript_28968:188-895(+)